MCSGSFWDSLVPIDFIWVRFPDYSLLKTGDYTMGAIYIITLILSAGLIPFVIWIYDLIMMPELVRRSNAGTY